MHPCHRAALDYQALGLHPIPCFPREKRPLVKWQSFQIQQPTRDQIDAWWTEYPEANVGLVLGRGIFAVDLDGGRPALELLAKGGILLPETSPTSRTGNGVHVLLSSPGPVPDRVALLSSPDPDVKSSVDIRGVGIIVAPPSIHPSGKQYEWIVPLTLPVPPAPQALLDLIRTGRLSETQETGCGWVDEAMRGVPEGQRDAMAARLAGYWLRLVGEADCLRILRPWAAACTPTFPEVELRKTVQSVARKDGVNHPKSESKERAVTLEHVSETLKVWLKQVDAGPVHLLPTPYPGINRCLDGGFAPGELIILGGRRGTGKSAMALELARHAAEEGSGTLIISREMVLTSLLRRMISQASRVSSSSIKRGTLTDQEWPRVSAAYNRLNAEPIWWSDSALSLEDIDSLATTWSQDTALGLILIDYLQLVRSPKTIRDRRLQVEHVSSGLKELAMRLKIPIVCLSSLRRPMEGDESKKPTLSDLRESGEIEHDADVVMLLHRPPLQEETEVIVAKARDAGGGVVHMRFDGPILTFEETQGDADG
jgi:archaellum biogenesis ATPase FlaH